MPEHLNSLLKKLKHLESILISQQETIKTDISSERDHICFLESNLRRLQSANIHLRKAREDTITQRGGSSVASRTRSFSKKSRAKNFLSPSALKNKLMSNDFMHNKSNIKEGADVTCFKTELRSSVHFVSTEKENSYGGDKRMISLQNKLNSRRAASRKSYQVGIIDGEDDRFKNEKR